MPERVAKNGRQYELDNMDHVNEYADVGMRTLLLAHREFNEEKIKKLSEKFNKARNLISIARELLIDEASEMVEKDLLLLGATVFEDKLQNGVCDPR